MNLEETILLSELSYEQKQNLKIWCPDSKRYILVYPKKLFWIAKKNIPIVDKENNPIIFSSVEEASKVLFELKNQA